MYLSTPNALGESYSPYQDPLPLPPPLTLPLSASFDASSHRSSLARLRSHADMTLYHYYSTPPLREVAKNINAMNANLSTSVDPSLLFFPSVLRLCSSSGGFIFDFQLSFNGLLYVFT